MWEIWGCFDNEWPRKYHLHLYHSSKSLIHTGFIALINVLVLPTIYISCTLGILLTIVSVCATWSVYKVHMRSLNIYWWVYYTLTVLAFLNSCVNMSIMCLGKDRFIAGCLDSESIQVSAEHCRDCQVMLPTCTRAWESATVWAAVGAMVTLTINVRFVLRTNKKQAGGMAYLSFSIRSFSPMRCIASSPRAGQRLHPPHNTTRMLHRRIILHHAPRTKFAWTKKGFRSLNSSEKILISQGNMTEATGSYGGTTRTNPINHASFFIFYFLHLPLF